MKRNLLLFSFFVLLSGSVMAQKYFQTRWQSRPRNVIVYLPRNFSPSENLPVVINMHGFSTTAQFQFDYTQFHKVADSVRCIVVYPEGVDLRWNSGTFFFVPSSIDDIGFLGDWMDRVAVLYNADMKKVYSMGYSAGGFMSYKLACDLTNRVAAIAPDVACMVYDNINSCVPARPIPIAAFNGLADAITPYAGFPGNFPSVDSIKYFWQVKNGCDVIPNIDTLPDLRNDGTRVVKYSYQNCGSSVQQVFYKILDGGHVWPGAADIFGGALGKTTQDISMNNEAWNFFKTKEIPVSVRCDAPANLQSTQVSIDSFNLSWTLAPGVTQSKIAVVDDSNRVTFYEITGNTLGVHIDTARRISWNVAALCSSGYHNWNTTRPLNYGATLVNQPTAIKIAVYPNPCSTILHVDLSSTRDQKLSVNIFNMLGEEVLVLDRLSADGNIDLSKLPKGCYQLQLKNTDKNYIAPFIKD